MKPSTDIRLDVPEMKTIRRQLHRHPETGLEEMHTADLVAGYLQNWGYQIHRGLAKTGVVGTLCNGSSSRAIGLRADMDGLPLKEQSGLPYASEIEGKISPYKI